MKKIFSIFLLTLSFSLVVMLQTGCYYDKEELLYPDNVCDTTNVTYSRSVAPVLSAACNGCHSGNTPSFNVRLDNYLSVKTQVDNNKLLGVINHTAGFYPMPKNAAKLTDCNIKLITNWVRSGALDN